MLETRIGDQRVRRGAGGRCEGAGQQRRHEIEEQAQGEPDTERDERRGRSSQDGHRAEHCEGEPQPDIDDRQHDPGDHPRDVPGAWRDPQPEQAEGGDQGSDGGEDQPDDEQPGRELPVDHVVPVDGLGQQARQRSQGPFSIDGIEAEGDPDERQHEADEAEEGEWELVAGDGEEPQEQRRRAACLSRSVANQLR